MKYIVFVDRAADMLGTDKWPKGGQMCSSDATKPMPIIFPEGLTHSVVMELLQKVYPGLTPVSAGEVSNSQDGWYCEGKSISLQLPSLGSLDQSIIDDALWVDLDN